MVFLVPKILNNLIALNYMYLHEKYHMIETLSVYLTGFVCWLGYFVDLTIELNPINRTFYKSGLLYKTITSCKRSGRRMVMAV